MNLKREKMKYKQIGIIFLCVLTFLSQAVKAQNTANVCVNAVVRTPEGEPIPGAVINSNEIKGYTVADDKGNFSVSVSPNSKLSVKATGYKDQLISAGDDVTEVVMQPSDDTNPVNIAFRTVEQKDLLGGISYINLPEFMAKDYTTYSLDGLQSYIGGYTGNVWGQGALVLIDGVPRDASSDIRSSEIEQIAVLKGAGAVALYGSRAAKGVVMITTKRGKAFDKRIDVRANTGLYVPKSYPQYLSSWEYMTLYNEALRNDGLDELYDKNTIYKSWEGKDPYRYPNIDFYSSDYLKKVYNKSDMTAEFSGGTERARFYTNAGLEYQNSLLNFGEGKNENSLRFNVRGNVDFKFSEILSASVDASVIINNSRSAHGNYWSTASTLRPNRFSPLIPVDAIAKDDASSWLIVNNSNYLIDGKYLLGGSQLDQTNPFADVYAKGYNKNANRRFQLNAGLDFNLEKVLKGLTFQTKFAIDYSSSYAESYENEYAVYAPSWYTYEGDNVIGSLTKYGEDRKNGEQNLGNSWNEQTMAFSAQFNYNTTINDDHNVSAILLGAGHQSTETGVYHKTSNANLGLLLAYNYQHKYYADFSSALVYSAKMAPKKRAAFSPTLTLGWRISDEAFLKDSPVVDNLKLTLSAGILHTDLDFDSYYMYQGYYSQTDGSYYGWKDGVSTLQTTNSRRGDNPELGFVKRKELNVGLEASLWKNLVNVNANFFINRMEGMPIQSDILYPNWLKTGYPITSDFIPYVNYNVDQRLGVDFAVNLNKHIGQVDFTLGMTGTYFKSKAIKRAELYDDAYQNRTGKPLDGLWGLKSNGLYQSEEDITDYGVTSSFGELKPGDIKYIDQNADGVIDSKDEVYLGRAGWSGAPFAFGINLTAKWKNFTFFARGTGSVGSYGMKDNSYYQVYGDRKYSEVVLNRWTEATKATATYPRLTTLSGDHNFHSSDFWLYKANRFDLAKVQVSYDIPYQVLKRTFVRTLGVYISGENLLTIAKERKLMEMSVGGTPQCRFFNIGVKASF